MARPPLEIDPKLVEAFAKLGATNTEIADHFMCDEGTIRKRFSEVLTKARAGRKIKLRELQWKLAEKGNLGMLIWLGKQELDQKDKNQHELSGRDGKPIETRDVSALSDKDLDAKLKAMLAKENKPND